ncbi:MAG: YchJ family protein [Chlamydiia bacterium]
MSDVSKPCPCCSSLPYDACCEPFHEGELPQNALQLMRSRYSAYALNLPDYIVATTHPSNRDYSADIISWVHSISAFSAKTTFQKLEILAFQDSGLDATVTFTAHLLQNGHDATFTEKSTFVKDHNRWLYRSGDKF